MYSVGIHFDLRFVLSFLSSAGFHFHARMHEYDFTMSNARLFAFVIVEICVLRSKVNHEIQIYLIIIILIIIDSKQ